MTNVYDCALIYTPQIWVEKFHRHCTNSGQLRIKSFIYDSTALFSDTYDVAIVSDAWPALNRSMVERIHSRGSRVIGVSDGSNDANEFLSSIGVDAILDSKKDAKLICEEAILLLDTLNIQKESYIDLTAEEHIENLDETIEDNEERTKVQSNVVTVFGTGGTGCTEMSTAISSRLIDSLLLDLDFEHPSIAPRANLYIEPHILDAIESAQNLKENFVDNINRLTKFSTIAGLTHSSMATDIRDYEITALIDESKSHFTNIILDCGTLQTHSRFDILQLAILKESDSIVIVGSCSPHGIIRVLETLVIATEYIQKCERDLDELNIEIIINNAEADDRLISQIKNEILYCGIDCDITFIQKNKAVWTLAWKGEFNYPKRWIRAFDNLIARISDVFNQKKVIASPSDQNKLVSGIK